MAGHEPPDLYQNTFRQFMDLFVEPEIRRRQEAGELPRPVALRKAQIVFFDDGTPPRVRLNDEVRCVGTVRLKPGVLRKEGEPIANGEIEGVENLDLPEEERDCGHATFLLVGGAWVLSFNFIYNRTTSARYVEMADEFYEAAQSSLAGGRTRAFLDSLFGAAELAAKSRLLGWFPDPRFKRKSSHKAILTRFHRYAFLGNAPPTHAQALSKLDTLRRQARYRAEKLRVSEKEAKELLQTVRGMIDECRSFLDGL